jgi:DNA-binding transcriptional MerR regulator
MTTTTEAPRWTVGKAARTAGLSPKAVRLYESKGLLPRAPRTEAGYRLYSDEDITVLRFIRQAKTLGLSLGEIHHILELRRGGSSPCQHVVVLLDERIRDIDRTIDGLRQLRGTLAETRSYAKQHQTEHAHSICGIIERSPSAARGHAGHTHHSRMGSRQTRLNRR